MGPTLLRIEINGAKIAHPNIHWAYCKKTQFIVDFERIWGMQIPLNWPQIWP